MNKNENLETEFLYQDYPHLNCKTCKAEFAPSREDQIFCSPKCCNKHHNRKRKNALAPVKDTVNELIKTKEKDKLKPFQKTISHLLQFANSTEHPTQAANQLSQILQNRKIIWELLSEKIEKIAYKDLREYGFNSNYFSGFDKEKNIAYLLDVGFERLPNEQIKLFKLSWK